MVMALNLHVMQESDKVSVSNERIPITQSVVDITELKKLPCKMKIHTYIKLCMHVCMIVCIYVYKVAKISYYACYLAMPDA